MNLLLVGINHRTAPVEVRERISILEGRLRDAVSDLVHREGIREALILSTCNRVEVLAHFEDGVDGESSLRRFLCDYHHSDLESLEPYFYWYRGGDFVRHLFRVASGLDSMILGEPQILGQVKQAYTAAREAGAIHGLLNDVVNQALAVARKVRRETAVGSAAVSVSYAAVELAKKIFGDLHGKFSWGTSFSGSPWPPTRWGCCSPYLLWCADGPPFRRGLLRSWVRGSGFTWLRSPFGVWS